MTSAKRREVGVKKCSKFADKPLYFVEKEGWVVKNPRSLRTSYMEAN